ncbi:glycosyltransferase [Teredinibacter haidensis]|uniref:glycosyltransferase n=1 Tax=Teredinibacter haidensis TaxID=2731755 RepID=UPI000B160CE2|nr:glycosyltransferase [Teredinibacter haidensis]
MVILSTADWDNPFWTNKQHVSVALAKMGYRIFYIDSLGLRRPAATASDFGRIRNRVKKGFMAPREVEENIWVWSPIVLPFQGVGLIRFTNRVLLSFWLSYWLKKLNFSKDVLWTYNPLTTRLLSCAKFKKLVYHCVDEIKAQPGMPSIILEEADVELCSKADIVFTTAPELYRTRKELNKETHYFSNVADFNHFSQALSSETKIPDELLNINGPIAGFIGAISGYKLDLSLIEYAAINCPAINFVFIGQVGEGDPWTNISKLQGLRNVYFLGPKNYTELPAYLKGMTVAMLPNLINEYTDSMFPMKFFEYLAAGKPVVSVGLNALFEHRRVCFLSSGYYEFIKNLSFACKNPERGIEERLELASKYTYDTRMRKMMDVFEEVK